jgi:zinc finger FYVE domain-containing protein 26
MLAYLQMIFSLSANDICLFWGCILSVSIIQYCVQPFLLMYRFPTLNRWIQMQTNLHRVSEFAVTANQTADDSNLEARSSVKRVREHDTETESDADDINSSTIPVALTDLNSQGVEAADFWHDSSKSEAQLDTTVFLSFDWDNEEPYQKAVERYYT